MLYTRSKTKKATIEVPTTRELALHKFSCLHEVTAWKKVPCSAAMIIGIPLCLT
jgi:hypothetical protein